MKKIFLILLILFIYCNIFAAQYKKIVSLAPSITQSLYDMGIDEEIAGITLFCPKGKSPKTVIGTLTEPNIEQIMLLKPDIIITTAEGTNKQYTDKLKRLGFNLYITDYYSDFEDICIIFLKLAKMLGKEETAGKIVKDVKKEVYEIYEKTKNLKKEKVFWEVGANPIFTTGKDSFINDYNKLAGGINIFDNLNMRYPNVSEESVIYKNPDIIILTNMGDITGEEITRWKKYKNINAIKNKRIYMLDANDIFTPTPYTFLKSLKLIEKILYDYEGKLSK